MDSNKLNLVTLATAFADEDKAREFLESQRWPEGAFCPRCGECEAYKLNLKADSHRPCRRGQYKCRGCRKMFTVRTGTVLEESRLPLRKWLVAFHLMCSSKKGVSSRQIERELGCTPKTAWFLTMRIREAMRQTGLQSLANEVEADETYVGPRKPRYKGTSGPGRSTVKQPVFVLVQRNGGARAMPVQDVGRETLRAEAKKHVQPTAILFTDEHRPYITIGREFGGHHTVNHSQGEYVRKVHDGLKVHNNTAESFFALLKRGHYGTFHHLSKHHLHRYCDEFSFRWCYRKVSDGERMIRAIEGGEGKRLYYRECKKQK